MTHRWTVDATSIDDVITQHRRRFAVPVRQPLVLISQIQRSGGTLISQLLDGHSQLHVHPGELHIGRPRKYDWPALDLAQPADALFDALVERPLVEYTQRGYQKVSHAEASVDPDYQQRVLPFIFHLRLQKDLFLDAVQRQPIVRQRDAIDAYITSYFNAWLDYQGLYREPAAVHYWATFGARVLSQPGNFARFAADYPDGRAIAVLRHPVSWYASARRHSGEYEDASAAAEAWRESFAVIRDNVRSDAGRTLIVQLEECSTDPEGTMRRVARFLGIGFEPSLLTPTFNGLPIQSDSSFGSKFGVDRTSADRRDLVPVPVRDAIMAVTASLYDELVDLARAQAVGLGEG
jgi:hypothetical protein